MKHKLTLAAVAVLLAFGTSAKAVQISGSINFAGGADLNGTVASATAITFIAPMITTTPNTGSYATVPAAVPVNFHNFTFAPFTAPVPDLWDFSYLGVTYSFTAVTQQAPQRNTADPLTQSLVLQGTGYANITGFEQTNGNWIVTVNTADGGTTFSFSASSSATPSIPDGGGTVVLLGLALSGVALLRRKLLGSV